MRFDLHLRDTVRQQIQTLAEEMQNWQMQVRIGDAEADHIRQAVCCFDHTTKRANLRVAGVDGSGDFPMLSYADSFVYLSVAQGTVYEADALTGLKEVAPIPEPVFEFHWIPEANGEGAQAIAEAFGKLAGKPVDEVVQQSDYQQLKRQETRKHFSVEELLNGLIIPHASDTGNGSSGSSMINDARSP